MNNADMPASPMTNSEGFSGNPKSVGCGGGWTSGLTKREHFAAMAMQGFLANYASTHFENCAEHAVKQADALLEELDK
jgi:hypothetical protein